MKRFIPVLLLAALLVSPVGAATLTGYAVRDGNGALQTFRADQNVDNSLSNHTVPEVGGTAVSSANPLPTAGANSSGTVTAIVASDNSAPINMSTATTTQIIALSGTKKTYIGSFNVVAGGTTNVTFVQGTGSNCVTGTTSLTGAYPLTAQAGIALGSGLGVVLLVPAGKALCVTSSAAVAVAGSVSYTQF